MDALQALDLAEAILASVDFISMYNKGDGQFSKEARQGINLVASTLTDALVKSKAKSQVLQDEHSKNVVSSMIALQNVASDCIHQTKEMLADEGVSQDSAKVTEPCPEPRKHFGVAVKRDSTSKAVFQNLTRNVSMDIQLIISSRLDQLDRTASLLKDTTSSLRPEQESKSDMLQKAIERLRNFVPDVSPSEHPNIYEPRSKADIQTIKNRLVTVTTIEAQLIASKVINSLNYASRPNRQDSVPQASKDTFQWAFDSRLSKWLQTGSGIFWITGLPGSGKSTFMKYIISQPKTKDLLTDWTGENNELAIAVHFFWIAGTPIQKSWQGLLQSLLFDVLSRHPLTTRIISPARYMAAQTGRWQDATAPWTVTELTSALRALASAKDLALRLCFFIDGLDEYESDHLELCKVLSDMAQSPHIKMCVSSRPWSVFRDSFGSDNNKMLKIHELTHQDIKRFVEEQLQGISKRGALTSPRATSEQTQLIEQIAKRANGVFLWAFFVTKTVRDGQSNGEPLGNLIARLQALPAELELLFKQMLESVNVQDQPKMAVILQAAAHALEPLHIDIYCQIERGLSEPGYAFRCPIEVEDPLKSDQLRQMSIRSINQKTKGLLKIVDHHVEFVHRTVKDFVLTREMGDYLRGKLSSDSDGFLSIATAYLGFLKTTKQDHYIFAGITRLGPGETSGSFISHLNRALIYAAEGLKSKQTSSSRHISVLLDLFEESTARMIRKGHVTVRGINSQSCDPRLLFREELVRHEVSSYISNRLLKDARFFEIFDESPLFAMLTPMVLSTGESPAPVFDTLRLILQQGEDPNSGPKIPDQHGTVSAWVRFARSVMSVFNMLSGPCMFPALRWNDSLDRGIFVLLLSHGADPNATLVPHSDSHTVFSHFLDISLSKFLGVECFDGYLKSLDAFLAAGASLDVPALHGLSPSDEILSGNLARPRPDESILKSYCTELKNHLSRLTADPERARFVSSVTEKLILHCRGDVTALTLLREAVALGMPKDIAQPLSRLIEVEQHGNKQTHRSKRSRRSGGFDQMPANPKHLKSDA